ncbi:MAG: hypothetical protein KGJ88_04035 [Verrucomicrobiota bacterium]|nr:hypothetical protein [Verrucomicrobiota bacterium]
MIIEESKALGASLLFFPEGAALQGGGVCSSALVPNPADPGWIDFQRVEAWEGSRKDAKYELVKDSTIGRLMLADEVEVDGYIEYKFTTNVVLGFIIGLFFRSATPLNANSYQFNPDAGLAPRGWIILDNRDQAGNLILVANLWGRLRFDGPWKGGNGALIKPDLLFNVYKNANNTLALGTQ